MNELFRKHEQQNEALDRVFDFIRLFVTRR